MKKIILFFILVLIGVNFSFCQMRPPKFKVATILEHTGDVYCITYSPDGKKMAAVQKKKIIVWDIERKEKIQTIVREDDRTYQRLHWPTQNILAAVGKKSEYNKIRMWDVSEGEEFVMKAIPFVNAISAKGNIVAVMHSRKKRFLLWNTDEDTMDIVNLENTGGNCIAFSKDGKMVVAGLLDGIMIYDTQKKVQTYILDKNYRQYEGHHNTAWTADFSPDGKLIATSGWAERLFLWDVKSKKLVKCYSGTGAAQELFFLAQGKYLVSTSKNPKYVGNLVVWMAKNGRFRRIKLDDPVRSLAVHPQKLQFATAVKKQIIIWDTK